ncbi:arginase family protein [Candidatus Thorarchaeota archaeon]|nr:MAG: arginase family protein [Candidatus Thorarchaeota archaeon]
MSLKDELNGYLRLPRTFFGLKPPDKGEPDVGVIGVPYDMTSSYMPGARFGPDAIRQATDGERSHSYPLSIGTKPSIQEPLSKLLTLEDVGDFEVSLRMPDAAAIDITEACAKLGKSDSKLLFLGGDHFITYPILKGLTRVKKGRWGLVYLDAHADLYDDMGGYQLSHASTVRRIINDNLVNTDDIVAHDIRSALPEHKKELDIDSKISINDCVSELGKRVDYMYISVDLDVLDPPLVPGVSHPESAGLTMIQLVDILRVIFSTGKVNHVDIVELNPLLDKNGITAITARDIVKEMLTGFAMS